MLSARLGHVADGGLLGHCLSRGRRHACSDMLNNVGARGGNSTIFMNSSPGAMAELGTQMRTAFTQAAAGSQALSQSMKRE